MNGEHSAHDGLSRRRFLAAAAGAAVSTSLPAFGRFALAAPPAPRFRRMSVTSAEGAKMLESYEAGVRAMMNLGFDHPCNWYRHALIHILDCPHGNWWFLPWHRGYLGWFEQTIRQLSGNPAFALPFWDWTTLKAVPDRFFQGLLNPGNSAYIATFDDFKQKLLGPLAAAWSGLTTAQRAQLEARGFRSADDVLEDIRARHFRITSSGRRIRSTAPALDQFTQQAVSEQTLQPAMDEPDFASFASGRSPNHATGALTRGVLESQPHDNVHGNVGGLMGAFLSPVDPLFFLHHANLDRLWSVWSERRAQAGGQPLPTGAALAAWSDEPFLFFQDAAGAPVSQRKAGDYAKTETFDYDYGPGWTPSVAAFIASAPTKVIKGALASTTLTLGRAATAQANVGASDLEAAGGAERAPATAEITIEPTANTEDALFHVFLNPPAARTELSADVPGFVGTLQFFGGTRHVHGPVTFTVPLRSAIAALRAANRLQPSQPLRIEVVPDTPGVARRALSAELRGVTVRMR